MGLILIVELQLKPGTVDQFMRIVGDNAQASVRDEPGCIRFDVLRPEGEADRVVLYEHYVDEKAFAVHLRTAHYRAFERAGGPLVAAESVRRLEGVRANPEERR